MLCRQAMLCCRRLMNGSACWRSCLHRLSTGCCCRKVFLVPARARQAGNCLQCFFIYNEECRRNILGDKILVIEWVVYAGLNFEVKWKEVKTINHQPPNNNKIPNHWSLQISFVSFLASSFLKAMGNVESWELWPNAMSRTNSQKKRISLSEFVPLLELSVLLFISLLLLQSHWIATHTLRNYCYLRKRNLFCCFNYRKLRNKQYRYTKMLDRERND